LPAARPAEANRNPARPQATVGTDAGAEQQDHGVMKKISRKAFSALGLVALAMPLGCGKEPEQVTYEPIVGRVVDVDKGTGTVRVEFYSLKHQEMRRQEGKLAPDAEILIDGAIGRMEDVRLGEEVRLEGRVERHGDEKRFVAIKVHVDRKKNDTAPATAPAIPTPPQ
jgi:hypothetical protein